MSSAEPGMFFSGIYTFNDKYESLWRANEVPPEGVPVAILIIDISHSMLEHKAGLAMAVTSIVHNTNVPKNFQIPEPRGSTGMVYAIARPKRD